MLKLIIDTDIGNDCDDAGALAVAHNLANQKYCDILAITSDTSRKDGALAIEIINQYYQKNIPVGMTKKSSFLDEQHGYGEYSRALVERYPQYINGRIIEDSTSLLRKTLALLNGKARFVCLGPLNNIADLMQSTPCLYSNLTGIELINQKIESFIIMGGEFQTEKQLYLEGKKMIAEWNILQDIKSAQYVIHHLMCPIVFVPYSVGLIKTGHLLFSDPNYHSPIKLSYQVHSKGPRQSWDPIAVYYAIMGESDLFELSDYGHVTVLDNGQTIFKKDKMGKHQYISKLTSNQKVIDCLNELII